MADKSEILKEYAEMQKKLAIMAGKEFTCDFCKKSISIQSLEKHALAETFIKMKSLELSDNQKNIVDIAEMWSTMFYWFAQGDVYDLVKRTLKLGGMENFELEYTRILKVIEAGEVKK